MPPSIDLTPLGESGAIDGPCPTRTRERSNSTEGSAYLMAIQQLTSIPLMQAEVRRLKTNPQAGRPGERNSSCKENQITGSQSSENAVDLHVGICFIDSSDELFECQRLNELGGVGHVLSRMRVHAAQKCFTDTATAFGNGVTAKSA